MSRYLHLYNIHKGLWSKTLWHLILSPCPGMYEVLLKGFKNIEVCIVKNISVCFWYRVTQPSVTTSNWSFAALASLTVRSRVTSSHFQMESTQSVTLSSFCSSAAAQTFDNITWTQLYYLSIITLGIIYLGCWADCSGDKAQGGSSSQTQAIFCSLWKVSGGVFSTPQCTSDASLSVWTSPDLTPGTPPQNHVNRARTWQEVRLFVLP